MSEAGIRQKITTSWCCSPPLETLPPHLRRNLSDMSGCLTATELRRLGNLGSSAHTTGARRHGSVKCLEAYPFIELCSCPAQLMGALEKFAHLHREMEPRPSRTSKILWDHIDLFALSVNYFSDGSARLQSVCSLGLPACRPATTSTVNSARLCIREVLYNATSDKSMFLMLSLRATKR
jgi:hypothetical protein